MTKLNLKKMIKGMSFEDMAKLLFADLDRQNETRGEERLLTPDEEDLIVKQCDKMNRIVDLNRLNELYKMTTLALADLRIATLRLELAKTKINMFVLGMYTYGRCYREMDPERAKTTKKLANMVSLFNPSELAAEDMSDKQFDEHVRKREPNIILQRFFANVVDAYKHVKSILYAFELIEQQAKICLLSDSDSAYLDIAKKEMKEVEELNCYLSIINLYKEFWESHLMKRDGFTQPCFAVWMEDHNKLLKFEDEDKRDVEARLERHFNKL